MNKFNDFDQDIINKVLPNVIKSIGENLAVPVIDIFNALGGADLKYKNYFCD